MQKDQAYIAKALELLPEGPYTQATWGEWTGALKEATGRKGKQLFMPLRLAITGLQRGPELADLLPLLGPEGTPGPITLIRLRGLTIKLSPMEPEETISAMRSKVILPRFVDQCFAV